MKDMESVGEAGRGQSGGLSLGCTKKVWPDSGREEGTDGRPLRYQSRCLVHNQIAAIVTNAIKSGASCEQQQPKK